jgi:hypothetical protein
MPQKSYSSYPKSHIFSTDEKTFGSSSSVYRTPRLFENRKAICDTSRSSRRKDGRD